MAPEELAAAAETTSAPPTGTTEGTSQTSETGSGLAPPRAGSPLGTAAAAPPSAEGGTVSPEGEKPPEAAEGETPPAPVTAEDWTKVLKLPEGVETDQGLLGKFTEFAATAKLVPEQAQGLVDMYFEGQKTIAERLGTEQQKAWDTVIDTWKAEIESDPVIGGSKKDRAQEVIGEALDAYGNQRTRDAFEATAAGWNPDIIRFVHKMALALSEGRPVVAGNPAPKGPKTLGNSIYGDEPMADTPTLQQL